MSLTSRTFTTIRVLVLGADSDGPPNMRLFNVLCTEGQIANGDHYQAAADTADLEGNTLAFDEHDRAWRWIDDDYLDSARDADQQIDIRPPLLDPDLAEMCNCLGIPDHDENDEQAHNDWLVDNFDKFAAIYWYAKFHHAGQASNLYSVLSTSIYKPGAGHSGPENEGDECVLAYNQLVDAFGGEPIATSEEVEALMDAENEAEEAEEFEREDQAIHEEILSDAAADEWTEADDQHATAEGWSIFVAGRKTWEIQRVDEENKFASDLEAEEHVKRMAANGNPLHEKALRLAQPNQHDPEPLAKEEVDRILNHPAVKAIFSSGNLEEGYDLDTTEQGFVALVKDLNNFRRAFSEVHVRGASDVLDRLADQLEAIVTGAAGLLEVYLELTPEQVVQSVRASANTERIRMEQRDIHPEDIKSIQHAREILEQNDGDESDDACDEYRYCITDLIERLVERNTEANASIADEESAHEETRKQLAKVQKEADSSYATAIRLAESSHAAMKMLEDIVCIHNPDRGVVLLSVDGPTHPEEHNGETIQVYDHEHFSPLGDALIALHEQLQGAKKVSSVNLGDRVHVAVVISAATPEVISCGAFASLEAARQYLADALHVKLDTKPDYQIGGSARFNDDEESKVTYIFETKLFARSPYE